MLLDPKTYKGAEFNIRFSLLIGTLSAFLFAWATLTLILPPKTPLRPFLEVQAVRLEALPVVPLTVRWGEKRRYLRVAHPDYLRDLDDAMERALSAAAGGAVGVPLAWVFVRLLTRRRKGPPPVVPRDFRPS